MSYMCAVRHAGVPLLFIDHSTPTPNRDAGSIASFHLLKIYKELGYNVTFVPTDLKFMGEYSKSLLKIGVNCPSIGNNQGVREYLAESGGKFEFIFICRAPLAARYIDVIRCHAPRAKIILNVSDLHYLREMRAAHVRGSVIGSWRAKRIEAIELRAIRDCDATIVVSSVELDLLRNALPHADIRLIPLLFVEAQQDCPSFESRSDVLFIGGFGHTPNVDAVTYFCRDIWPRVRAAVPGVMFHVVGDIPPALARNFAKNPGVIVHGHVRDISDVFRSVRLSIAPLRFGAGIKGKLATSLSYGVPVVCTSMAVEGMKEEIGRYVAIADDPADFASAVIRIYNDPSLWKRLSDGGREQALKAYSHERVRGEIEKLMMRIRSGNAAHG